MNVTIIQGVWKEGSKKNNLLWKCLWPCGTLKFQIEFWALMPTSTNNEIEQNKTKNEFVLQTMSSPFNFFLVQTNWFSVWNDSKMMPSKLNHHLICLDPAPLFRGARTGNFFTLKLIIQRLLQIYNKNLPSNLTKLKALLKWHL
jgi:hypothetical protein